MAGRMKEYPIEFDRYSLRAGDKFSTVRLDLSLGPGEILFLKGKLGTGKSLLAEAIAGIQRPGVSSQGRIKLHKDTTIGFRAQDARLMVLSTDRVSSLLHPPFDQRKSEFYEELALQWNLDLQRISGLRYRELSTSERILCLTAQVFQPSTRLIVVDGFSESLSSWQRKLMKEAIQKKQEAGAALIITDRNPPPRELEISHLVQCQQSEPETLALSLARPPSKGRARHAHPLLELDRARIKLGRNRILKRSRSLPVLNRASLYLRHGEVLALLGPQGSGKSTLLEAVAGLHRVQSGRILFNGRDMTHATGRRLKKLRKSVQLIFQDAAQILAPDRTVLMLLEQAIRLSDASSTPVEHFIERVGLSAKLLHASAGELSAGEAQRVDLARSLAVDPTLLLFDEPRVAGVDSDDGVLASTIRGFAQGSSACLLATSDPGVARALADRIAVIYAGKIIELGPTNQVLQSPGHPATYELLAQKRLPLRQQEDASGCFYASTCPQRQIPQCDEREPALAPLPQKRSRQGNQRVACYFPHHTHPLPK
ncbi:MAG: ATP-binding cassette domain-containing protein [Polyangiaceae bacterium]|nr:ATP-binding cassette domain-containing protein [Polyangiaceae bacterium]